MASEETISVNSNMTDILKGRARVHNVWTLQRHLVRRLICKTKKKLNAFSKP